MKLHKQMTETHTEELDIVCLCVHTCIHIWGAGGGDGTRGVHADIICVADARVNSFISLATPN